MWKETKKQQEVTERHKYCDVCGAEIIIGLACSSAKCMYCGNDLCEKCIGHEDGTHGDYRDVFCKKCWEIGEPYRPVIDKLHTEIDQLYSEWQAKCKTDVRD